MAEKLEWAGQFQIEKANILTSAGTILPIEKNIISITIYEDMERPMITGECSFHDQASITTIGPLTGQEFFQLKLKTPKLPDGKDSTIDFSENVLHIYAVHKLNVGKGSEMVQFKFISGEYIKNNRLRISQKLEGSPDSIVKDMLGRVECRKDRYIETASDNKKILAPNIRPFSVIRMMARQARTARDNAPNFSFWESLKGYHFRSLDSCYLSGRRWHYVTKHPGYEAQRRGRRDLIAELQTIDTYSMNWNNLVDDTKNGILASELLVHDITKKSYSTHIYNYFNNHEFERKIDGGYPIYSQSPVNETEKRISDVQGKIMLKPNSTLPFGIRAGRDSQHHTKNGLSIYEPYSPEKWLQRRSSQLTQLNKGLALTISVPGNTVVSCGDMIKVTLPHQAVVKESDAPKSDKVFSGSFLVKKIKHEFVVATFHHAMKMALYKDTISEELPVTTESYEPQPDKEGELYTDLYHDEIVNATEDYLL